ncbi:MAG: prolipoprotein diacylglyceryl transferase [Gammaproteobacteria bacterium]
MLTYPDIDPVAVHIGPLAVHWYGLMYLVGFVGGWWLGIVRAKRPGSGWHPEEIGDLLFYAALGVVLGGRIGYTLFYNLPDFIHQPLVIFKVWQGGMSFHGGLIGVLLAVWLYGRRTSRGFFQVTDFIAPLVPVGLGAGRIGNFINGELWGKVTDLPWGMRLSCSRFWEYCGGRTSGFSLPHQPSQLYEFLLEGVALFIILWLFSRKPRPTMAVSGMFLLCYGIFRFTIEFVRLPDPQLGYLAFGWVTMGQVLSFPMILIGAGFLWWAYRYKTAGVVDAR